MMAETGKKNVVDADAHDFYIASDFYYVNDFYFDDGVELMTDCQINDYENYAECYWSYCGGYDEG